MEHITEIEVFPRAGDKWRASDDTWRNRMHAHIKGAFSKWAIGNTTEEAIGALIAAFPEAFKIKITRR